VTKGVFEPADRPINKRIDEAYRTKYRGSPYLSPMIDTRDATVRVMPMKVE